MISSTSYTYPSQDVDSIESALFGVWQGDYASWQAIRRQAVDHDLGRLPEARLALLLGEEAVGHQLPDTRRNALTTYLFLLGCEAIEADRLAVTDGMAPLLRHFFAFPANDLSINYGSMLLELLLPKLQLALEANTLDLSLATGLTGVFMSMGAGLADRMTDRRIKDYVSEFRRLLKEYVYQLQLWQLPVNSTDEQYTMLPNRIVQTDAIWEAPEQTCWASGDVGQALFLTRASQWLQQPDLATWAIRIATYTIFCRIIGRLTVDPAGIRYGKAGMMLLYHQLYKLTGEPLLEQETIYWQRQLLDRLPTLESAARPDHSLLDGLLGIYGALRATNQGDLTLHGLLLD